MSINSWDICKNCGGERGIHHYQTNQCPVGGREAPGTQRQEYKTTTFEMEPTEQMEDLELLRKMVASLTRLAGELQRRIERLENALQEHEKKDRETAHERRNDF